MSIIDIKVWKDLPLYYKNIHYYINMYYPDFIRDNLNVNKIIIKYNFTNYAIFFNDKYSITLAENN